MKFHAYIVLGLFFEIVISAAGSTTPVFSNTSYSCAQLNQTHLSCQDGSPITVGFVVSAPYSPYYGNFTLSRTDYVNVSEPVNVFGGRCKINNGASTTCFVTLKSFSIFSGNGDVKERLKFLLTSDIYPQVFYYWYLNFTVSHYLNSTESKFISIYNPTVHNYLQENQTYWRICGKYEVCDAYIQNGLYSSNFNITQSVLQVNKTQIMNAYASISIANATLINLLPRITNFTNRTAVIIIDDDVAGAIFANMTNQYKVAKANLTNCHSGGRSGADQVNSIIANVSGYPKQKTASGAAIYLGYVRNQSAKERSIIDSCGASFLGSGIFGSVGSAGDYLMHNNLYLFALLLVIILLYGWRRYHNMKEIKRIRESHNKEEAQLEPAEQNKMEGEEK